MHHSHMGGGADTTRNTLGKSRVWGYRPHLGGKAEWPSYSTTIRSFRRSAADTDVSPRAAQP